MLPDYPKLKSRIAERQRRELERAINANMGVFSEVPSTLRQEGARCVMRREDGTVDTIEPQRMEAMATMPVDLTRLEDFDPARLRTIFSELAAGLAKERMGHLINRMDQAVESVGNVTDTPGIEGIFEGLEKIQLDFDEHGNPPRMSMVFGSEKTRDRVLQLYEEIERTPELRRRHEAIMARKREEWRDREAARNLVE